MIKNPKFSDVLNRSIFDHSGSNGNCPRDNYFNVIQNVATKYTPQQVCKVIKRALEVKKASNRRKRNSKHPQFTSLSVRGVVGKLVFDDLPTLSKVSLSERASPRGLITTKASMKRMMSALKIFSMVQARKETPDHVSVQEECLNSSCPKEFSLVGINSAILKTKNFGRGICKLIFFNRVVCLSEVLLVDGAVEYNP